MNNQEKNAAKLRERILTEVCEIAPLAEDAMRKSCNHVLRIGLRLGWLHSNTVSMGGDRKSGSVSHSGTLIEEEGANGFRTALDRTGYRKSTAYRWMKKVAEIAGDHGIAGCPEPDSEDWQTLEAAISSYTGTLSIRRLAIGQTEDKTDIDRQEKLISAIEAGSPDAEKFYDDVCAGTKTFSTAYRGLTGAEATKGEKRADPVYLKYDLKKKKVTGLVPSAITALQNAFKNWASYEEDDRAEVRKQWREMLRKAPKELLDEL